VNKDVINLTIPNKPDYISLVRLTTSGIGSSMALDIDCIEDIKVSIGEACINALLKDDEDNISIAFEIDEEKITINVSNVIEDIPEDVEEKKERELGLLIVKSLMDKVDFTENGIEMIKYIEVDV
jgi:serine/threonine-protein kinase RsbW